MAMKKDNLDLFFLGKDKADDFLEAEQSGEEDGTAVDGKGDDETNHPVEIQLLDEEGDQSDGGQEKEDVKPISPAYFQFQDALGEQILKESRNGLDAKASAGRTDSLEPRYDNEIQQDIDDYACRRHKVELLQAAIGGEECAEYVGC